LCTNGDQDGVGSRRTSSQRNPAKYTGALLRLLLGDVDLLFLVYVTEEIDQATDERYCGKTKRHPAIILATLRVRKRNKFIEVKDRTGGGQKSYYHREYVFQAFHFEPPAS
jgi:hypothetical protein